MTLKIESCLALAGICEAMVTWISQAIDNKRTGTEQYTTFGDDPHVVGGPPSSRFSAWTYARQRCAQLCARGLLIDQLFSRVRKVKERAFG